MSLRNVTILGSLAASLAVVGCQTTPPTVDGVPTGKSLYKAKAEVLTADAGIPLADPIGKTTVQDIAKTMQVPYRPNPFTLTVAEVRFDRAQRTERLLNEAGGFVNLFTPTMDIESAPKPLAPRPLWRISGIVVSEGGIVALLDMGNNKSMVIRPGTQVPPYVVDSLDRDRAVLRRLDDQEPKYVTIELSGPLTGSGQTAPTGGGQAAPGRPPVNPNGPPAPTGVGDFDK